MKKNGFPKEWKKKNFSKAADLLKTRRLSFRIDEQTYNILKQHNVDISDLCRLVIKWKIDQLKISN